MIKVARENGADLVKFQLFDAEDDKGKPHYDWVKAHELTFKQAEMLFNYGKGIGIEIFFSVFAPKFVDWCEAIGVKRYKIASEIRDLALLESIKQTKKPIVISVREGTHIGISTSWLWLYCPRGYPQKTIEMPMFSDERITYTGFSDHTIGLDASKIALARGAKIIEKHFSLCYTMGVDGQWSMTPEDLKELKRWEQVVKQVL